LHLIVNNFLSISKKIFQVLVTRISPDTTTNFEL